MLPAPCTVMYTPLSAPSTRSPGRGKSGGDTFQVACPTCRAGLALDEDEFVRRPIFHRKVKVVGIGVLAILRHVQVAG